MKLIATATVTYTCEISEEEVQKIINYAEEEEMPLSNAAWNLYQQGEIHLYDNSTESDFSTEDIEVEEE
jgi:hypothetical protein